MQILVNSVADKGCVRLDAVVEPIAAKIKIARQVAGWTREELARKAGVSRSIIQVMEKHRP